MEMWLIITSCGFLGNSNIIDKTRWWFRNAVSRTLQENVKMDVELV